MRRLLVGLCGALGLALVAVPPVTADSPVLPLGDPTLVETRESTVLAEGVTLTRIVRGRKYARENQIQTTTRGPWRVNVLEIDPTLAAGTLRSTFGRDLARVDKVTALAPAAGALAAVNASFFTFTASKLYPGRKIGQYCFFNLTSPAQNPYGSEKYGSRYQGQRGPTASRSFQSFHRTKI